MNYNKSELYTILERFSNILDSVQQARKTRFEYSFFLDSFVKETNNAYVDENCYTVSKDILWLEELQIAHQCKISSMTEEIQSRATQIIAALSTPPFVVEKDLINNLYSMIEQVETLLLANKLQTTIMKLTTLEYDVEYKSTVYSKFMETIFRSIRDNLKEYPKKKKEEIRTKVILDTKQFLGSLSEKEYGQLAIEHYTLNYNRNAGMFLDALSYRHGISLMVLTIYDTLFKDTLNSLNTDLHLKGTNGVEQCLKYMSQTEFYQKYFTEDQEKWQKKKE